MTTKRITNRRDTPEGSTLEIDGKRFIVVPRGGRWYYCRNDLAVQGEIGGYATRDEAVADALAYTAELAATEGR
jgi:hypothetical protein